MSLITNSLITTELSMIDRLCDCLRQQLSEFELLKSMYPNHGEIVLTDNNYLEEIKYFLSTKPEYTPNHLDFVVNLCLNDLKLEMCVNLPSLYPCEEPDIYVRCNQLKRQQETMLNTELSNYLKNNQFGEVCIFTAVSWLMDNAVEFNNNDTGNHSVSTINEESNTCEDKYVRMWIYSHHIYNKKKREEIAKEAKELHLTGFCLSGKPGIVCIEGPSRDCKEWWKNIKSMTWKKIILKKTEEFDASEWDKNQKFYNFEELIFKKSSRNDKHADMSAFSKFMEKRGLSENFSEVLGLDLSSA